MARPSSKTINHPVFWLLCAIMLQVSLQFLLPSLALAQRYPRRGTGSYYSSSPYLRERTSSSPFLRYAAGYGIPYGYLGINGEFSLLEYISLMGGMGYSPGGSSWIMGARVYTNRRSRRFRPRISMLYGTVSVLTKRYGPEETYENDQGYGYGLGFEWKVVDPARYSLDFDIIMTDYDVPPGYEKKGPEIKFSLGFGRLF